jgi:CDP-diacylglycerol--serine O-phosphatidyltransferase
MWRNEIKKRNRFKRRRKVNIAKLTKISFLPSIFTIFSLFLGFLALLQIFKGKFETAVFLIGGSVIMDGFDGTVARLTKTESNFGVQLDSLVDAISFGLTPSVMIYMWGFQDINPPIGKVIAFIYLTAGVVRLARFNVLKEVHAVPTNIFVGLPIPLGALAISSAVFIIDIDKALTRPNGEAQMLVFSFYVLLVSLLMVSTIKYRTMKKLKSKNNLLILLILAIIVAFAINFPRYTIPSLAFIYIISPAFFYVFYKFRKQKQPQQPVGPTQAEDIPGIEGES